MNHELLMENLKKELNNIIKVIPPYSEIVYVDYPVHYNVGDLLIFKGTEKFFEDNKINVVHRVHTKNANVDLICEKFPDCIVVCHGGGNFGDIYQEPQNLRLELINRFKGKIVILPQTIHYDCMKKKQSDIDIFKKNKNVYFFIRDEKSHKEALEFTPNVFLSPDMAHQLWPLTAARMKSSGDLLFYRRDIEAIDLDNLSDEDSYDWYDLITLLDKVLLLLIVKFSSRSNSLNASKFIFNIWSLISQRKINKAVNLFSKYEKIKTSRLHGHILASLLNKSSFVIDNSYGKNSSYVKCWTYKSEKVLLNEN